MFTTTVNRFDLDSALDLISPTNGTDDVKLDGLSGGGTIRAFEVAFSQAVGADYTLAMSSGTAAIHSALLATGVGPGDEVIVSAYGWGQTVAAVLFTGATPVFADIDASTANVNPQEVRRNITERTKAVLVTHIFGLPADMNELSSLCRKRQIYLIADAAQALGAEYLNCPIGSWGDIVCFSFGRGKAITTGEGGAAVTNNPDLYERMELVSQHPIRVLRDVEDAGLRKSCTEFCNSYRMSPLSAAIGLIQLPTLPARMRERRFAVKFLAKNIEAIGCILQPSSLGVQNAYHSLVAVPEVGTENAIHECMNELSKIGLAAVRGPVKKPLHLRFPFNGDAPAWFPKSLVPVQRNKSWLAGSCPIAERRCNEQELLIEIPSAKSALRIAAPLQPNGTVH